MAKVTADLFKYLTTTVNITQKEVMFRSNNIIPQYVSIFHDFSVILLNNIHNTYLGDDVIENDEEIHGHYSWCFNKTVELFKEEDLTFKKDSTLFDYLYLFFYETYYHTSDVREMRHYKSFFDDLFNLNKLMTMADVEMLIDYYSMFRESINN